MKTQEALFTGKLRNSEIVNLGKLRDSEIVNLGKLRNSEIVNLGKKGMRLRKLRKRRDWVRNSENVNFVP